MNDNRCRQGFTLLELLVSMGIIALLAALLLPSVQSTREAARRTQCRNNLRQLGLGVMNFESTHRHLPGNGWGYLWIGDPDRGVGPDQPGGWIYQLQPYIDQESAAKQGRGLTGQEQEDQLTALLRTPQPLLKCPTRPGQQVLPVLAELVYRNAPAAVEAARTDYAVNEGDWITNTGAGPLSLEQGDQSGYPWDDTRKATGVSFQRSRIHMRDLLDGASNVYLAGEKYVSTLGDTEAVDPGHDSTLYGGVDLDINRWTLDTPLPDNPDVFDRRFGSAHPQGCYFVFCDGSVRQVSYSIDAHLHQSLGHRSDGGDASSL